jgi:hypothetical protein
MYAKSNEHQRALSEAAKRRWQNPEERQKMSDRISGTHPNRSAAGREQSREQARKNLGRINSPENRTKMQKVRSANGRIVGPVGFPHSKETRDKMSRIKTEAIRSGEFNPFSQGTCGYFWSEKNQESLRYRSLWEKSAYELLESMDEVASYEPEPFSIDYKFEGRTHRYVPDILVQYKSGRVELVEIRPSWRLQQPKERAKFEAARKFCAEWGVPFRVWNDKSTEVKRNG